MILTIKNFKCFLNAKFNFEDNTNCLITAPSGYGKSSIFEAIRFVFWGNRDADIITFCKKKCEVTLEYKDYIFKRSKNPNYFSIVSKKIGTIENPNDFIDIHFPKYPFKFISFSPLKQTEILNKISSNNKNIPSLQENLKHRITEGNNEIKLHKNNLNIYEKTLENLPNYSEDIVKPEENKHDDEQILIMELKHLKKKEQDMINSNEIFNNNYLEVVELRNKCNLENKQNDLETYIINLHSSILNYNNNTSKILCITKKLDKYNNDKNLIDEIYKIEKSLEILNYKKIHNDKINTEINTILQTISCKDIPKNNLLKYIDNILDKDLLCNDENAQYEKIYKCPDCNINLIIENGKLVKQKDKNPNINKFKKIKKLLLSMYESKELEEINELILKLNFLNSLKKDKEDLEILNKENKNVDIKNLKQQLKQKEELHYNLKLLESCELKLLNTRKYSTEDLILIRQEISQIEFKLKNIKEYQRNLKDWELNEKIKINRFHYINLINETKSLIDRDLATLENICKLKRLIEESQSESLSSLILQINEKLRILNSEFFTDEIIIKLEEYKQINSSKSLKPQIDINIKYKGNNIKINNLSSGEYARIELMFDIILYDITNNNCPLLLDEVTANLDSDTSSHILNIINKYFKGKNIYVIAHQAIEGVFDNVITDEYFDKNCHRI